ncbi:MAG: hypothetical protein Q9219_005277 [cf. Caloplaca sp. 3 TL-2023]
MSPTKKSNLKKEYPLVLLHVTLLPIPQLYSAEVMERVLPNQILESWKILREKATDTVVERGILIAHPKEDYDLMEDRLLETLDLKTPRILKCGHFHLDPDEEIDVQGSDTEEVDYESNDADICVDCGRRVRDGKYGSGTGSWRWDIKVYAANGLMRAGAWSAAWREMERVDVEITPWMDDELKRELALRTEEDRKHAAMLHEEAIGREDQGMPMDEERIREIYGEDIPTYADEKAEPTLSPQSLQSKSGQQGEIPLQDLLRNYVFAAAQDRKNITILILSLFALYLSIFAKSAPRSHPSASYSPVVSSSSSSSSSSTPYSTSVNQPSSSTSVLPSLEPSSAISQSDIPSVSTAAQGEETDVSPSLEPHITADNIMDSIEARFEFAGE